MAIVKNLIPKREKKPVVVDDFFDPLFNRRAKEQIRNKYGVDNFATPVYGFADLIDNTFIPRENSWGPLGPAMGILGNFGRTLDKAEDFILGGITEGTNAVNQINPLSSTPDVKVHNPLEQVFIEDEDYTGEKLLSAMANNMGRLAGNTVVTEQDFDGTWKPTTLGIELATDPGIFGGFLAKNTVNSSAKSIGQLLSNYDDIVTRGAWDVTIPGVRTTIKNHLGQIRQLLAANTATPYKDVPLKNLINGTKSTEEFVNEIVDKNIFDANQRWQDAIASVQEMSKTFDDIPNVTKVLRSEIDEIEKNLVELGYGGDELTAITRDIRGKLDDIDSYIADPKQFNTELFNPQTITDTVNNALAVKDFDDIARNSTYSSARVNEDIVQALGDETGLGVLSKETGLPRAEYILPEQELSDLDYEALNSELADYLKEMSDNPGHPLDLKYAGIKYTPQDKFNKVLEGDYFEDEWASQIASKKAKELIENTPRQKHLVKFTTSVYKNANSEIGNAAVKYLQDNVKSIEPLKKLFYGDKLDDETYKLFDYISEKDIKYLENNVNKLQGLTKNNSNLDILNAAEAISDKLKYIKKKSYNLPTGLSYALDTLPRTLDDIVKTAKYGYGDYNIQDAIRTFNESLSYYKDFWDINSYTMVKNYLRDVDSPVDIVLDKNFKLPFSKAIEGNPRYAGYTIRDPNQLLDIIRKRMNYGIYPNATSEFILNNSKYQKGLLKKANASWASNIYAKLGIDDLNPLEADYVKYISSELRNAGDLKFLKGDIKDKLINDLKKQGLDFDLNYRNVDTFLLSPPKPKETPEEMIKTLTVDADELMRVGKERAVEASKKALAELPDNAFEKYVISPQDLNNDMFLNTIKKRIEDSGIPEDEGRTLFKLISEEMQVPIKTSRGAYHTLRTERVRKALFDSLDIMKRYGLENGKYDKKAYAQFARHTSMYYNHADALNGDITKADSFLDELFDAGGINIHPVDKIKNKAKFDRLRNEIMHNIITVNRAAGGKDPILKLVETNIDKNKTILGYVLNTDNKNAIVQFSKMNLPEGALKDITWEAPNLEKAAAIKKEFDASGAKFTFDELDAIRENAQKSSEDFSRMIGYDDFKSNYFMHAMTYSDHAERFLSSKVYKGIDLDKLDTMSKEFQSYRKTGYQHAFGISPVSRRLRGSIDAWNNLAPDVNIFSVNPYEITRRTFTDGIFADANFQNHVGMFFNPNFRISSYAENIDDLKKIIFARDKNGNLTGNMDNLILASPKYNESGRLIGYTQYDKFNDKALERALKNPETVLLPTHALAPLDKLLRKDLKMSNKVYAFINKYFTIPVKFGTLTNLGFLTGNLGDAYLKQAITMSEKYGTSVAYELARNAESVKNVVALNNKFDGTFTKYVEDMKKAMGKDFIPYYELTDSLISTPKAKLNFEEWIEKSLALGRISQGEANVSRLWLYLNNYEQVMTGDFQNLGDLLEMQSKSEYAKPLNPAEKLINKAVNIKPTKGVMWASGKVEEYARAAEILNDLTRRYSSKEIYEILGDPEKYAKEFDMMNVKLSEALNTMNASNFNYEYLNDVLDSFGSLVPFPTFVTKNFAYWLDIMVNKPEVMDSIINAQEVAWRGKDTASDQFQAEAKGRGAIPLRASKDSKFLKGIFKPTPYQSMFGAFDLLQNPVENLAFRVNPIATPITHHLQKPENDKYRPYSFDPYEKNVKRGDPNYSVLRATFHRLNPYDRTLQNWLRLPANVSSNNAQISNVLPSVFQPDFSKTSSNKNKKRQ